METDLFLNNIITSNAKRLEFVRKELKSLPQGKLYEEHHKGKPYYIHVYYEEGKRIRRGINHESEIIKGLIKRRIYERELEALLSRQKILKTCQTKLPAFDLTLEIKYLQKSFPALKEDYIINAFRDSDADEWAKASYEKSSYHAEQCTQITSRGLKVRSKSEVLIAEKLYEHNISFHYEEVLNAYKSTLIPDFTIRRSDGKLFYWEHQGLTNNKEYLNHQVIKLQHYAAINIFPWDNLIITYDNSAGFIDLRRVEFEIENRLEL